VGSLHSICLVTLRADAESASVSSVQAVGAGTYESYPLATVGHKENYGVSQFVTLIDLKLTDFLE
jgi:hypothetical protein